MMTSTDLRKAADRVDDAYAAYVSEWSDEIAAYDFREEGYRLGEIAARMHPDARDEFIEECVEEAPDSAQYLISVAAHYRLAEVLARPAAEVRKAA